MLHERRSRKYERFSAPLRRWWHATKSHCQAIGLIAKLKSVLAFVQVLATLENTYSIGLPESWMRWTRVLRFFGDIDWTHWVMPGDCIVGAGIVERLLLRALGPLAIVVAVPLASATVAITARCRASMKADTTRRRSRSSMSNALLSPRDTVSTGLLEGLPVSLVVAFCFTPSVSASIFRAWHCVAFAYDDLEKQSFLAQDLSVRCDGSDEHSQVLAVAWVLVAIWPVGMVAGYAALLVPCHSMLLTDSHDDSSQLLRATQFLHRDYKAAYYWWEIASLLQRTMLTGWLLLVDGETPFVRLVAALVITISYLVALLACNPYKRSLDYGMAAGCQLLLVCLFIGGIMVRLYEDIAHDTVGSPELAYRFLGLQSSDDAVVVMIIVAFAMLVLLVFTLAGETYAHAMQQRLEQKWTVSTMNPPSVRWKLHGIYACFLSHYKMEAASDARYMHDVLRKMLRAPVFLDSSALNDLRNLVTQGVHESDTVVLLATKSVLTRPWCLLELLETTREGIPVVIVQISNGGWRYDEARRHMANFESEMTKLNPSGLQLLYERLGPDLGELKEAVVDALDANEKTGKPLIFNAHAGDNALVAMMKDLIERLAEATGRSISWSGGESSEPLNWNPIQPFRRKSVKPPDGNAGNRASRRQHNEVKNAESAIFFCCSRQDALGHARVLRSASEVKLDRGCAIGGGADSSEFIEKSELCVVLLTKQLLCDPVALLEVWMALQCGLPLVTVLVAGAGYDYATAAIVLADLPAALDNVQLGTAARLQAELPDSINVETVGGMLHANLTAIIAISWSPFDSKNHRDSVVDDVLVRMPQKRRRGSGMRKLSVASFPEMSPRRRGSLEAPRSGRVSVPVPGRVSTPLPPPVLKEPAEQVVSARPASKADVSAAVSSL